MKLKKYSLIFIASFLLSILSCKKDSNKYENVHLYGNWKFIYLDVNLQNKGNYNDGNTAVNWINISSYSTNKTVGTVIINPNTISIDKLSFYAPTTYNFDITFKNNIITDSSTFKSDIQSSIMTKTTNFRFAGTDSIYTSSTGLANLDNFVNQAATSGGGLKYMFNGDTLVFISPFHQNYIDNSFGESAKVVNDATTKMFFIRQ